MVRELSARQLIPNDAANQLVAAIGVANRALHGEPVTDDEVNVAVEEALSALDAPIIGRSVIIDSG